MGKRLKEQQVNLGIIVKEMVSIESSNIDTMESLINSEELEYGLDKLY